MIQVLVVMSALGLVAGDLSADILKAVSSNDVEEVKSILEQNKHIYPAFINTREQGSGQTPLMKSVLMGHTEIVRQGGDLAENPDQKTKNRRFELSWSFMINVHQGLGFDNILFEHFLLFSSQNVYFLAPIISRPDSARGQAAAGAGDGGCGGRGEGRLHAAPRGGLPGPGGDREAAAGGRPQPRPQLLPRGRLRAATPSLLGPRAAPR